MPLGFDHPIWLSVWLQVSLLVNLELRVAADSVYLMAAWEDGAALFEDRELQIGAFALPLDHFASEVAACHLEHRGLRCGGHRPAPWGDGV
jgi:hypothetical protein